MNKPQNAMTGVDRSQSFDVVYLIKRLQGDLCSGDVSDDSEVSPMR